MQEDLFKDCTESDALLPSHSPPSAQQSECPLPPFLIGSKLYQKENIWPRALLKKDESNQCRQNEQSKCSLPLPVGSYDTDRQAQVLQRRDLETVSGESKQAQQKRPKGANKRVSYPKRNGPPMLSHIKVHIQQPKPKPLVNLLVSNRQPGITGYLKKNQI